MIAGLQKFQGLFRPAKAISGARTGQNRSTGLNPGIGLIPAVELAWSQEYNSRQSGFLALPPSTGPPELARETAA